MRARLTAPRASTRASRAARSAPSTSARETIVWHLQRTVGNRAVSRMVRQPIQRLIITGNLDQDPEYEKVKRFMVEVKGVPNRTAVPGDVIQITTTDPNEVLYILQHGGQPERNKPGTVMGWSPEQLLGILKTMGFDPSKHKGDIQLLSCYSAFTLTNKGADRSFAQRFATLLRDPNNNYTGSVWGVSGSLNPLHVRGPEVAITATHLWQGDPTYLRMQQIDTLRTKYSEHFYVIEDYIDGEQEKTAGEWKKTLEGYVDSAIWAADVAQHVVDNLADFGTYQNKVKNWRNRLIDTLRATLPFVDDKKTDNVSPNNIQNKDQLKKVIETNHSLVNEFETILREYHEARKGQGYEQGITDSLFKPLEMVRF